MSIIIVDKFSHNCNITIANINRKIKLDNKESGVAIPKKLPTGNFIILLKDSKSNTIMSLIWYGFYENNEFGKILHVNYSYTFNEFRNNGYNKILRLKLELIGTNNNANYITSCPFQSSKSKQILIKLGYISKKNCFYKKIN